MASYGVPFQGSKSAIAKWLVDLLPPSHTFVDLFAGGCAVTHCAMLSGDLHMGAIGDRRYRTSCGGFDPHEIERIQCTSAALAGRW